MSAPNSDDLHVIDVLFVYAQNEVRPGTDPYEIIPRNQLSNTSKAQLMKTLAVNYVEKANLAFIKNGLNFRVNFLGLRRIDERVVTYLPMKPAPGNNKRSLFDSVQLFNAIQYPTNSDSPETLSLRRQFTEGFDPSLPLPDVVTLITTTAGDVDGRAALPKVDKYDPSDLKPLYNEKGVISKNTKPLGSGLIYLQASSNDSHRFTHELIHLFFTSDESGYKKDERFRTLMTYSSNCKAPCPRIDYLENPKFTFPQGHPFAGLSLAEAGLPYEDSNHFRVASNIHFVESFSKTLAEKAGNTVKSMYRPQKPALETVKVKEAKLELTDFREKCSVLLEPLPEIEGDLPIWIDGIEGGDIANRLNPRIEIINRSGESLSDSVTSPFVAMQLLARTGEQIRIELTLPGNAAHEYRQIFNLHLSHHFQKTFECRLMREPQGCPKIDSFKYGIDKSCVSQMPELGHYGEINISVYQAGRPVVGSSSTSARYPSRWRAAMR
jgi:hypothetical protein